MSVFRNSHRRCSVTKDVLRNFAKFTEKCLCQSLFFNKVAGLRSAILSKKRLRPVTLLKKRLCRRYFPVNFAKFLRKPFLQNISGRLLQHLVSRRYGSKLRVDDRSSFSSNGNNLSRFNDKRVKQL